jgi:acyl transferase domain-containing protein/phosphopantetheinyl transferase
MSRANSSDIAIIGMACVFPGASNLQRYWENILGKVNAISDAPPEWEPELFYEADTKADDRTYCKRGGFLGKLAQFDPFAFGIMPNAVDGGEPDHFMALQTAHDAVKDCGKLDLEAVKERTAIILGRGTYVNRGNAAALQQGVMVDAVLRILKQLHPEHSEVELAEVKRRLKASLPPFHADTASGLVPNIITGRIANRLDLMGPNFLVDAACASSLVAVEIAVRELETGRCDLAIAGGVHANTSPVLVMIFSQLGALSRRGQLSSFDKDADGTLLGEGVGMVVLKRLADAERDTNHIYAVLKNIGVASDGRATHVLAPRVEGEETALRRAYERDSIDPLTIGLMEAHGTGTPVGDVVEVEALRRVFADRKTESPRCALGSVKSMISHTVPAAGAAGLIKAALALHHKVLPPTLCENPNPQLQLDKTNFYINTETRPWIHGSSKTPRRAGVNAFGFGGINAHAILEEYTGPNAAPCLQHDWDSELFVFSGQSRAEVQQDALKTSQLLKETGDSLPLKDLAWTLNCQRPMAPVRMAVVATSHADLDAKLQRAMQRIGDERTRNIKEIEGIYHFREPQAQQGKLGFLFPGEGSQYRNMLGDLCIHFPEVRRIFDLMDRAYENHPRDYLPSDVIFPPPLGSPSQERLWNMDSGAETVFCANQALYALIERLGLRADAMVGHSTGEHSALLASRVVQVADDEELIRHILGVYEVFDRLNATSNIPEAVLLAIAGADHKFLEEQVAASGGELYIALDNCVHQVVLCGKEPVIDRLVQVLTPKGAICQKLPFTRAYHTPWFEVFSKPLKNHFERLRIGSAQSALYSCVTAGPYPQDPEEIRSLAAVQWSSTVRFRETIEAMYRDGVRLFVEIGPSSHLTGFTDDVLRSRPHAAIPSNVQHRSGILQLQHMLGQLVAHGMDPNLEHLYARRAPRPVTTESKPKRMMKLATGLQPVRLPADFHLPKKPEPERQTEAGQLPTAAVPAPAASPTFTPEGLSRQTVVLEHLSTIEQLVRTQQQVMAAYLAARQRTPLPQTIPQQPGLPFFNEIVEVVPGVRAVARHRFSSEREIIFHDHALGRDVSTEDPSLVGLPMVPLTVTMEILAEGGALLAPGKLLVGMRDIRATRWITLEKPDYTIEATAQQTAPGEVHVALREAGTASTLRPILAEAVVMFADRYPNSGPPRPFVLEDEQRSAWVPEQLYRTGMFHGALMQGTKSVERTGRNGTSATIEVLPHVQLISGDSQPAFLFDPVLLDAAGQVVAYWFWEAIEKGTDLFPYRVGAFHCYASSPVAGTRLECRVVRRLENDKVIHSDIEVLDNAGKVYYRLENWETRRFVQPPRFLHLRIDPRAAYVSTPWNESVVGIAGSDLACCRVDDLPEEFLESSHGIWLKALAYLVLGRRERETWHNMTAVPKRRREWLLGRCAAKDAVRRLIQKRFGLQLCAADVEILTDASGRPMVEGAWRQRLAAYPVVSITHSGGIAAAVAALDPKQLIGIDMEHMGMRPEQFDGVAFSEKERHWLQGVSNGLREEWALRLWCAKESAAKALGQGLSTALNGLRVSGVEVDTGRVQLELTDGLLQQLPYMRGKALTACTQRNADLISSTLVYVPGATS